jgi:hypothetical protein
MEGLKVRLSSELYLITIRLPLSLDSYATRNGGTYGFAKKKLGCLLGYTQKPQNRFFFITPVAAGVDSDCG